MIHRTGVRRLLAGSTMLFGLIVGSGHAATTDASINVFDGTGALDSVAGGEANGAYGFNALTSLTTGSENTAVGTSALQSLVSGSFNTAIGVGTLLNSTTATNNVAIGNDALNGNTTGSGSTAVGVSALARNSTGAENSAFGLAALFANTTGNYNSGFGTNALDSNTTGSYNAAFGYHALDASTVAGFNTALGGFGMRDNTTGARNTGAGYFALGNNTSGNDNTALGYASGFRLTTGRNNIHIANFGLAAETRTIKIGAQGTQNRTFIAGIRGTTVSGVAVLVSASGQLGVQSSSARFKEDIETMAPSVSERLLQLRPVTFRYKQADEAGEKPLQYGLIAEEVAKVYPELVAYDDTGKPEAVAYHTLSSLLLNEYQQQHRQLLATDEQAQAIYAELAVLRQQAKAREQELVTLRGELSELRQLTQQLVVSQRAAAVVAQK